MKVFLSHAMAAPDGPIAARLRAVAAAYDIQVLLPERSKRSLITRETQRKILQSDAVVALITSVDSTNINAVNCELQAAVAANKPIVALAEHPENIVGVPGGQVVKFDRSNPTAHERDLVQALQIIRQQRTQSQVPTILGWIVAIALGLVALSALTGHEE
jgi:nucleoside 2-deoxyribosyltransferase